MVNQAAIDSAKNTIIEIIKQSNPSFDTRRGLVNHELIIGMAALGIATIQEDIDKFELSNTLSDIAENPDSVDSSIVDGLLSNFRITRKPGSPAKGSVRVTVNEERDYTIISGTQFVTQGSLAFTNESEFTVSASELVPDGVNFFFILPIVSSGNGEQFNVPSGTAFTTNVLPVQIVSITAAVDFFDGSEEESVSDAIADIDNKMGTRDFVSRRSISSLLLSEDNFPDITQVRVLGFSDRELQRSVSSVGVKTGLAYDILYRTKDMQSEILEISTDSDGIAVIPESHRPFLRVKSVARKANSQDKNDPQLIVESLRGDTEPKFVRFSVFEKVSLQTDFEDNTVLVEIDKLPLTSDVQDFANDDEIENICSDVIVKTLMPAFISAKIKYKSSSILDKDSIKSAIVSFINSYEEQTFFVSQLIKVMANINGVISIDIPVDVTATYHLPDGTTQAITDVTEISVPENISLGISDKTYSFYSTVSDISLEEEVI